MAIQFSNHLDGTHACPLSLLTFVPRPLPPTTVFLTTTLLSPQGPTTLNPCLSNMANVPCVDELPSAGAFPHRRTRARQSSFHGIIG